VLAAVGNAGAHGVSFVGNASAVLPPFAVPNFALHSVRQLAESAFAIALVGLLEATAISRSLAMKSGQDVDVNQEFIGQGLSNAVGSFFSAYMGSGSFTRSALNYEAGAKTPLSAILASIILFLVLLLFGRWTILIPIPAIAGIVLLVAVRLLELKHIASVMRTSNTSSIVMLVTFFATLFVGLEFGVYVGVLVSLSFFLRRSASPYLATIAPDPNTERKSFRNARAFNLDECPQLGFTRLDGQLYFGSLEDIRRQLRGLERQHPAQINMILLMKGVGDIDMPGAQLLIEEAKRRRQRGGNLFLTARQHQVSESLGRYGVIAAVGSQYVYTSKGEAIESIVPQLDPDICSRCDKRIFRECPERSE
jgi:SulP family sulfate permease